MFASAFQNSKHVQSTFPGFYRFVIVLYLMVRILTKSLGMRLKRATAIYLSSIFRNISPELTPITLSSTTSSIEKFSKPYNTRLNYDFNAGFLHILECKRRHFSRAFSKPLLSFTFFKTLGSESFPNLKI